MATLSLSKVFVNRLDSGEAIAAQSGPDRPQQHDVDGDVKTFAGGRQRSIAKAGERGQFAFTLVDLTLVTVALLRTWMNIPVQVRDHRGQRFFGVFFAVPVRESKTPTLYDVTITLRVVTVAEGA